MPPPPIYPLALDIRDQRCVIVGGGVVAERKARGLLAAGASVMVIAPEVASALAALAREGSVRLERRPYAAGDLTGARLVFAATNRREVNAAVSAEARALGVLVSVADRPAEGNVSLPAIARRGAFTIAVFTSGRSPLIAALARDRLAASLSAGFIGLLDRVAVLRRAWRHEATRPTPAQWRRALDWETVALADAGDLDAAESRLRAALALPLESDVMATMTSASDPGRRR